MSYGRVIIQIEQHFECFGIFIRAYINRPLKSSYFQLNKPYSSEIPQTQQFFTSSWSSSYVFWKSKNNIFVLLESAPPAANVMLRLLCTLIHCISESEYFGQLSLVYQEHDCEQHFKRTRLYVREEKKCSFYLFLCIHFIIYGWWQILISQTGSFPTKKKASTIFPLEETFTFTFTSTPHCPFTNWLSFMFLAWILPYRYYSLCVCELLKVSKCEMWVHPKFPIKKPWIAINFTTTTQIIQNTTDKNRIWKFRILFGVYTEKNNIVPTKPSTIITLKQQEFEKSLHHQNDQV